jgi:hypothetical protein
MPPAETMRNLEWSVRVSGDQVCECWKFVLERMRERAREKGTTEEREGKGR